MPQGIKKDNDYQKLLSYEFYEKCPKSVITALLVSFVMLQHDDKGLLEELILNEWRILHENGIVPQKPFRTPKI